MKNNPALSLILVFALITLGPLAIDIYLPSIPQMVDVFGVSESEMQLTISVYVFSLGIVQLVAGPVSDRFGRKTSAILGLIFYIAGSLLVALSPSVAVLYIARALQGAGASFATVTAMAWIRDNYDGVTAGKWLSYMGGMTSVIPTAAPLIGGLLAIAWGWTAGFYTMAALAAFLFLMTLAVLKSGKTTTVANNLGDKAQLACNTRDVLTNRQFRAYALANMAGFGGVLTSIATTPIVGITEGGLSEMGFAVMFGIIGLSQFFNSMFAPKVVNRIGQRKTVKIGLVMTAIAGFGLIVLPAGQTLPFFLLAALGAGGFSMQVGTSTALALESFKHCAGLAVSIEGFMRMIGGASIAAIAAWLNIGSINTLAVAFLLTLIPLFLVRRENQSYFNKTEAA